MQFLRDLLDKIEPHVQKGGRFEAFGSAYEAVDTLAFSPGIQTRTASHVRDGLDYKRMMFLVVMALGPCLGFALWNTGFQAALAIEAGATPLGDWQNAAFQMIGGAYDSGAILWNIVFGALYFLPIFIVVHVVGLGIEIVTAQIRDLEVTEGFLVTGALLPLLLPPTIPLWQVALGTAFGLIIGKEVFGGTGMNFLNPALVCRAFLFFAYPAYMSGDAPWIAADFLDVDGFTGATLLAQAAAQEGVLHTQSWWWAFFGGIPGSMGETSTLACLIGAGLLIQTGVGSWRTMLGTLVGTIAMAMLLNAIGSDTNPMFSVPWHWHVVLGGWALGTVFMCTDPVSSAYTDGGKLVYGFGIGVLCIIIRCINPAYPEGMMLAILFMNMFAPLIDHFVVRRNIARRLARSGA
ncbi:MAG: NADH:ubiquinone reductase (Na(+)-transporting) subunit B [Deltaproteobacteria bacterium]|jgi:Na+-transporting NADH:ubiquinone oxidoreductase subunit B|nr:NADH:ubiquinone reductase (Na(+)-transporting) subunit B [Deltaproteobacteria bacterium]